MPLLDSVKNGAEIKAPIILLHGPSGSRKTQVAVDAGALILQTEDGLGNRSAPRLTINKLSDLYDVIKEMATTEHQYKALAIDSLDHLAPIVAADVCERNGKASLEAFGYGKGAVAEADEWRKVFDYLSRLRNRKQIPIILIAHQAIRSVNDPTLMDPYDRYEPKLPKAVNALAKECVDVLGCVSQQIILKENDQGRTKASGTGEFVVHVVQRPAYEAKNRYGITNSIPMNWEAINNAITEKNK
jgi:hypothetical protein